MRLHLTLISGLTVQHVSAFNFPFRSSFDFGLQYVIHAPTRLFQKPQPIQPSALDLWLKEEEKVALDRLLANIAPRGRNTHGAVPGTVLASPSKEHPNYFYQWVRDAAITTGTLVDIYSDHPTSNLSKRLTTILNEYASLQNTLQHTKNPSGDFKNLAGLGEPKFEADGSAFTGSWGRPQRDGPALRAITLMAYVRAYNASHPELWGTLAGDAWFDPFYAAFMPPESVIKADLEYVSHYWKRKGFDLWEEVNGLHFFTAMVQYRALREGAVLATAFGDEGAAKWYVKQAELLSRFLGKFWDQGRGHLVATLETDRSGLDCSVLLGSIHGLLAEGVYDRPLYPPWSDEVLVSLLAFVKDQRMRFPINRLPATVDGKSRILEGIGLGRYPEDVYDGYGDAPSGGNPWFLCTASAAEILYRAAEHFRSVPTITISQLGLPFYSALLANSSLNLSPDMTYTSDTAVFQEIVGRLKRVGDQFLEVVKRHADKDGRLSEQFDRVTGFERGARDLTWSYGAVLQVIRWRKKVV